MIAAITMTTSKFGPSGSSKKKNIALEHIIDVSPRITNNVFFELKFIFVIILESLAGSSDTFDILKFFYVIFHSSIIT